MPQNRKRRKRRKKREMRKRIPMILILRTILHLEIMIHDIAMAGHHLERNRNLRTWGVNFRTRFIA
jgi:uncharacterized phosphosugar-binding protein